MAVDVKRRLFTVDEYYKMAEAGILTEDDRVELIDGEIVEMPPIGSPHGGTTGFLHDFFSDRLRGRAIAFAQHSVRLGVYSEPQPDIVVVRARDDYYRRSHPTPADVYFLIEVCDTTIASDRRLKLPMYARAGIPEVWLVDLNAGRVEVYTGASEQGYADVRILGRGGTLSPTAFPDVVVGVDEVLG
ncbi:MAG: Uma2 family endonuclease [Chloroflexi bacterium]|nr:Uma2 family endonuclease [Chloroflexota bacterium]